MGTETAIAWTDHTFNPSGKQRLALDRLRNGLIATVKSIVASVAKCDAVADDYSQFGECRKGLDVVCVEIPSAGVPAVLASEPVTQINIVAPLLEDTKRLADVVIVALRMASTHPSGPIVLAEAIDERLRGKKADEEQRKLSGR